MACSKEKQKQLVEAAKLEYKRLADMQKQGYEEDLENDVLDIQESMDNLRAVIYKKPERIVVSEPKQLDAGWINELNTNKPKLDNKVPITIVGGVEKSDGKLVYTYKYLNNNKEYKVQAARVVADQVDARNTGRVYDMLVKESGGEATLGGMSTSEYSKAMKEVILKLVNPTVKKDSLLTTKAIWSLLNDMKVNSGQYLPRDHTVSFLQTKEVEGEIAESIFDKDYSDYGDIKKELMNTDVFQKRVEFTKNELKKYTNDHTIVHELIHAGSVTFMAKNPNHPATKRVHDIFELAKQEIGEGADINFGYWKENRDEFLAEALSNPRMIRELMAIKPKNKMSKLSNLFESLVNTLLGMLGIEGKQRESLFEYLLDGYFAMVENQFVNKNPKNTALDEDIKKEADVLKAKMGSDPDARIGETEQDQFLGQETLDLGQVLAEEFNNYYGLDVESGNQVQTKEFADLQNTIVKTYQDTMKDLGTGALNLRMFENMQDQTAGEIDLRTNEMQIRWNKMSRLSRVSEIFLHEINHKMSAHVFANNMNLRRLMEDLRDSAIRSGVTYKLFLEGIDKPTKEEIEIAKMKFEYTFDRTADVEEFYAYATTNENVYNAIKNVMVDTPLIKSIELDPKKKQPMLKVLNVLIKTVNDVWRLLSGRGARGGQMIAEMVATIARLDVEQEQAKWQAEQGDEGISGYAKVKINQLDEAIKPVTDKVDEWTEKASPRQGAKWMAKHIAKIPVLNELMETGIAQFLWRTVTQDTTTEDVADMYMVFRHSKQVVEKHTSDIRNGTLKVAKEYYKDLDSATKNAITRVVLEGDMAQLSAVELKEYLADGKKVEAEINRLEKLVYGNDKLVADKDKREQIEGLVEYLISGKTVVHNQQINANNIAANLMSDTHGKPNKDMVANIDRLVSLKVLKNSDANQLELLSEVDADTLDKTITMYLGYIDNMRKDAVVGIYDPVPKGYTRAADGLLRYELIPEEEVEAQQSVLMKKVEEKPYTIVEGKKYYLMTGRTKSVGFNEGAIGLISHTTEGIPVSSLIRKNNELAGNNGLIDGELRNKTKNIIKSISENDKDVLKKFKLEAGQSMVPVYNHQNEIVDYRIQLTKLEKELHLPDRETELEDIMSNTFSRSIKTSLTATENKKVIDTIIENSARGVLEDPDSYVFVEEYTEEDRINGVKREKRHDRWEYLPDHTKDYIFKKTGSKSIPIHKDFVELMTGEKDITIGNFAKFGVDIKKYPVARARLMALEAYVKEILMYVKQAMIVLDGNILVGNQVSNAIVAITHGIDPIKYTKKFKQRWQQLNDYNEKVQMLAELEVKKMAGEKVDGKIRQLERQLDGNIWNELVKDGQYTALVEDINVEAKMDGQLKQQMQKYIDESKFGGMINTAKNMLYINKTTPLYNTMLKTVHYGDAITRQIIKEELEEKAIKRDGKVTSKTEREILNYLDQLLVNYGYTLNRWWGYAEKAGGLFFMKYYLNQAKALMSMAKKNQTKMGLMQGTQYLTGVDIADPLDTYTNSGIDGVVYRMMFDDAPGLILKPNILDLVPDLSSALVIR
jgi:hypothetical protein